MEFLEPKSRQKFPNETFANFRRFFRAKRIFWAFLTVRNRQVKLLETSDGVLGANGIFGHF